MSKDERIYLERIAVALEEKAEIEHPDKGYLDSKTYMERIADAVEQLPSGGGGITPTGNIEITENTAEGETLNIAPYATATVNVAGGGLDLATMEVTFENVGSDTANVSIRYINEGYISRGLSVNSNATANCIAPIEFAPSPFPPVPDMYVVEFKGVRTPGENTLVNCTLDRNPSTGDCSLLITDPTQPASAIIPVYGGGIG